jgi:gliding motility-associated-like protein
MNKKYFNIILFLFCSWPVCIIGQIDIRNTKPVMKLVSVQPATGFTEISWESVPSSAVAGYRALYYDSGSRGFFRFQTLSDPSILNCIDYSRIATHSSQTYAIEAIDAADNFGKLSESLSTIFSVVKADTCNKKITISWNKAFSSPKKVTGYSIMMRSNAGSFRLAGDVSPNDTSFTLSDFTTDSYYCFYIKANLEGGTFSTSNEACLTTTMQRPPDWINADYATVNPDNKIDLSFTFDPFSEIKQFRMERRRGLSGQFKEIGKPVSSSGSVLFTDIKPSTDTVYYYRLSAINNCGIPITVSNTSSNIVVSLNRTGDDLNLLWNSYKNWNGIISSYNVFINTGNGFEEKAALLAIDTTFVVGYKDIMYRVTGNEVCFYITASENSNPHGISGQSRSATVCTASTEVITVPNVFTPNNDLLNDLFRPVLSFTPLDYHLIISNRQGKTLFETRDFLAEWDGFQNGDPQPQGVCLWFLKVTTPSGKSITRTGTITIIK